jgi:filamentous hemagglutinin
MVSGHLASAEDEAARGSILIQGSRLQAGQTASLTAAGQIRLQAAQNTTQQSTTSRSSASSLGITAGTAGTGVTASTSRSGGNASGEDLTHTNTRIDAAKVQLQSGADTELRRAVVNADTVQARIGGDLRITSPQDTRTWNEQSSSSGASLAVGASPNLSVSAGRTDIKSHYTSVGEQSALRAGDGGFQVEVQGRTALTGGAITSTQQAIDQQRDRFTSQGGVSTQDVNNSASYDARSGGVTLGLGSALDRTAAGTGSASGQAASTTAAAISGIAGNSGARTGDAGAALAPIFDAQRIQAEVNAQTQITSAFGRLAVPAAAQLADARALELRRQGNEAEARQWDEGGAYRVGLYSGLGLISGGAAGAAGAAATASVIPSVGEEIAALNLPEPVRQGLTDLMGLGLGALAGGSEGAATGLTQTALNYVSHSPYAEVRRIVSQENARLANLCGADCTLEELRGYDTYLAQLESAATFAKFAREGRQLTTEQATRIAQLALELSPVGTAESIAQLLTGKEALTGEEANRFWAAVGAIPLAGGGLKLVGRGLEGGITFVKATVEGDSLLLNGYRLSSQWADASGNLVWRNPLTNALENIPAGAKVHVDHRLPKAEFGNIPGFDRLPPDIQRQLINAPENLQPMLASANCSKGCRVEWQSGWSYWNGQRIDDDYALYLSEAQARVLNKVKTELKARGLQ